MLNGIRFMPYLDLPVPPLSAPRMFYTEADLRKWHPKVEEAWETYKRDVIKIAQTAEDAGMSFLVFDVPFPFEQDSYDDATLALYEPDKSNRMVETFFQEAGLPHAPLLEHLRAHPDPSILYYPANAHLTPEGVEYLARPIAEKMRSLWNLQ